MLTALAVLACVSAVVGGYAWFANRALKPDLDADADEVLQRRADPTYVPSARAQATRNEQIAFFASLVFGYAAICVGLWLHTKTGWVQGFGWALAMSGFAAFVLRIGVAMRVRRRARRTRQVAS